jgi:cytochrome c-type biogenesis protein
MPALEPFTLAPAAFLAGVLMFLAPCTLPIVPGYLAFIAGGEGRVVRNAIFFVLGFAVVFIVLGSFAGLIGSFILPWKNVISRVAGVIIILFGLTMLGVLRLPMLSSEAHIKLPKFLSLGHPQSSFLVGALFALGWSPCIGPILGTVLLVASTSLTVVQGAILLAVFSFGLGIPFILSAMLLNKAGEMFAKWGRATVVLSKIGGVILICIGVLMVLGDMGLLITWGYGLFDSWGYSKLLNYL